jgi:hypothetical protein
MATSLAILGCSQRKNDTARPIPAIDRYDGPVFRVFRKHAREAAQTVADACVLSALFGLIPGNLLIPRYDHRITGTNDPALRLRVERQLKQTLDEIQPDRLFVSVGSDYWPLLEEPLAQQISPASLVVATGSIGGRASQFVHWLRSSEAKPTEPAPAQARSEAVLLGTAVRLSQADVLRTARAALTSEPIAARRFETWYVPVSGDRVAPKWLVSILFDKPVARFRTADARRVLSLLGVECIYADNH